MDNVAADVKREMLKVLLELYTGKRHIENLYGLCSHLGKALGRYPDRAKLYKTWPEYSENTDYPVPSYNGSSAEYAYESTCDMWRTDTEYGRARWRLLWWCCTELMRELGEVQQIEPPPIPLDAELANKVRALYVGAA